MNRFFQELETQRWDDHRYYHHSRINQSLHLLSAVCFVVAYGLLFIEPAWAALLAWTVSMTSRQAGHFFFEPRGYDEVNQATDAYKEAIKVGYNIRRKVVLMGIWVLAPVLLWLQPSLFGQITPWGSRGCCSGWRNYGYNKICGPVWSGPRRSSPTRFTTSCFTTKPLWRCCVVS